jgi:hypothetical protein
VVHALRAALKNAPSAAEEAALEAIRAVRASLAAEAGGCSVCGPRRPGRVAGFWVRGHGRAGRGGEVGSDKQVVEGIN